MQIKKLKLNNFRNFADGDISINEGTTVFYGGVGEGKTNIIEAVFLLSVGRSYRTSENQQLISWGKSEAYVRGEGQNSSGSLAVAIKISKDSKRIEMNGENNKRSIELIGGLRSVIFHSDDVWMISGAPHHRRRFLDIAISQSSKNYAYNLRDYYRVLKQRNAVLSSGKQDAGEWDEQLSTLGCWITQVRKNVLNEITNNAVNIMSSLAGNAKKLEIKYVPSGDEDHEVFKMKLAKAAYIDAARGSTSVGPHRDDVKILLDGADARHFASSGEKKTIALSMKMAEVELIRSVTSEKPILLLDDVFSTLDAKRSKALLSATGDGSQCIITLTDIKFMREEFRTGSSLYEVKDGRIRQSEAKE